jgi:hypothetical protein
MGLARTASGKSRVSPRPFKAKPKPEGYVFGRPTEYRPEYCQSVIEVMGEGYDLTGFAGTVSVARETVYRWMEAHEDFRHAVNIGRSKRLFALQRKLLNTQIGVGVTAAIFALKNADPENWQDRYNTEATVTHRLEHVSDERLLSIAAQSKVLEHDPTPRLTHTNERQHVAKDDGRE